MPTALLQQVKQKAGHLAYGSVLYNWSLGGDLPEGLLAKPVDPWPGDIEHGKLLTRGTFSLHGETLNAHGNFWEPLEERDVWLDHLHKFEWLRDLRALGGDQARFPARAYIENWLDRYHGWHESAWHPARTGRRLAMWIALFDFYGESADEEFQDRVYDAMIRQGRHLAHVLPERLHGTELLEALMGLIYAGLAVPGGEKWLERGLQLLVKEANRQILSDGGHISRSPSQLLKSVMILSDIRCALLGTGYPLPEAIQHALDRAGPALRFFRISDRHFSVFHGAQEGDAGLIDRVILNLGVKGKVPRSLPQTGYERIVQGRTMMMVDTGRPPEWPDDIATHAAPGAFELSHGRERIFVNCGTHPIEETWSDLLRGTAAHNALGIDHRNAFEIRDNGHIGRAARKLETLREDLADGACLVTLRHDGYVPLNGLMHQRRLYVGHQGQDIRGEELLRATAGRPAKPAEVSIRFHLHPRVLVSLVQEDSEALLRLPGGSGWRFYHEGTSLTLENSIYLGQGTYPRKTKQLVLRATLQDKETTIQWALQKEG